MAQIRFTSHLKRFFPDLRSGDEIDGQTVAEVVTALDRRYPGIAAYLVDERGSLRKHVNIFIGEHLVHDRETLSDPLSENAQIYIMQALSGG
jgi:sulfur-carrier protein